MTSSKRQARNKSAQKKQEITGKPQEAKESHRKQRKATGSKGKPQEAKESHRKQRKATGSKGS